METRSVLITAVMFCAVGIIGAGCSSQEQETWVEDTSAAPREVWQYVTVRATVEAIDYQSREVTLRGPRGNAITFTADERVRRLDEIKAGDEVVADYYVSVATELREPTAEEKESPLTVVAGAAKAPSGIPPGVGGVSQIRAVVTIVGIDRPAETVMVKGPMGRYAAVRVLYPDRLEKLRLGDTVVVTYTEAVAISVEKAK
ncbi:MAG: hypothetical protein ACYTBJ_21635 [Planctomycetota bacterium]|jgi:hypothetical protein